jgi:hypothetical protein
MRVNHIKRGIKFDSDENIVTANYYFFRIKSYLLIKVFSKKKHLACSSHLWLPRSLKNLFILVKIVSSCERKKQNEIYHKQTFVDMQFGAKLPT